MVKRVAWQVFISILLSQDVIVAGKDSIYYTLPVIHEKVGTIVNHCRSFDEAAPRVKSRREFQDLNSTLKKVVCV